MTRRHFFTGSAAGLALGAVKLHADPLGLPIGCQLYPVRKAVGTDFEGTLRDLASIGYRTVEMCSPPGYANSGFGTLIGMKPADLQSKIHAAGLRCESCHFQFTELKEHLDERIGYASELGLKQMILASFGLRPEAGIDDWTKAAGELNRIGERVRKAGLQLGYHNHNSEVSRIGGVLVYDRLMSAFDPQLVKLQFQVAVVSLGFDAVPFIDRNPGRFLSLHLQDWSAAEKKEVPIGQGSVDWKQLFTAAKKGGIKNYFVEMNMDALKASYPFLHQLKV